MGPSLEIVFIIKANRYDSLFFHSLNSEHFIFPVLCDKEGEFEENNLLPINKEYNAFCWIQITRLYMSGHRY